jgi:hypothetical protein
MMRRNRMLAFHPKRNRILKGAWGVLLIFALIPLGTPIYGSAGSNGNPFSNGTFFPSAGTFQAIMRGKNLTGVATFSTVGAGDEITASGGGIFSVFFNGITYVGNVNSAIDVNSGQIAATFQGSNEPVLEGEGTTTVSSEFGLISETFEQGGTTENFQSGGTNSVDSIVDNVIELPAGGTAVLPDGTSVEGPATITAPETLTTTTVTPDVTTRDTTPDTLTREFGFTDTIVNFQFVDVLYAAGAFLANLRDSFPNQSFDGKGSFSFSQLVSSTEGIPVVATETVKFKVDGVRVSNDVLNFMPFEVQVPIVVVTGVETQAGEGGGGGTPTPTPSPTPTPTPSPTPTPTPTPTP